MRPLIKCNSYYVHYVVSCPVILAERSVVLHPCCPQMNDVPAGGRTIFPYINVAVTPLKGSAVLWFNLDREGRMLPEVFHGGCPVLKGSKWGEDALLYSCRIFL